MRPLWEMEAEGSWLHLPRCQRRHGIFEAMPRLPTDAVRPLRAQVCRQTRIAEEQPLDNRWRVLLREGTLQNSCDGAEENSQTLETMRAMACVRKWIRHAARAPSRRKAAMLRAHQLRKTITLMINKVPSKFIDRNFGRFAFVLAVFADMFLQVSAFSGDQGRYNRPKMEPS